MKKIIQYTFNCYVLLVSVSVFGQDSLKLTDMQSFTYSFSLENGQLRGQGAAILTKAVANAHITMLGDNNRSKLESVFTSALMEELAKNRYQNIALETGLGSNTLLGKSVASPNAVIDKWKSMNQKYGIGNTENLLVPVPDFKSVEAVQFLESAIRKNWSVFALGTDSWTNYQLLLDKLFANLSLANQTVYDSLYQASSDVLQNAYGQVTTQNNETVKIFIQTVKAAPAFTDFLAKMATFNKNKPLIEAIQFSLDYWERYGQLDFYTKNLRQAQRNKQLLRKQLEAQSFDFSQDKLFIKMWVNHLAKGTTVNGFYGVGNMLQELAAYHGNTCVNIAIARRFYEENGTVKDILENNNPYLNFKELIPLGQKDTWTLIDLRPFNETFYWQGFQMSVAMHKILSRYDFLVIPKTDEVGSPNY